MNSRFFYCWHNILYKGYAVINKLVVDIEKIKQKISIFKKANVQVCASIKADAYGMGMLNIARNIKNMVDYFAVAKVYELSLLRRAGIFTKTIILSPLLYNEIELAIRLGGEISVDSIERLKEVQNVAYKINKIAKVHIQIDTGMRRFGVSSLRDYLAMLDVIRDGMNVTLVGVYSHFYSGSSSSQCKQREIFERIILETHRKQFFPIFHIAASSGAMEKLNRFDMVRLGICLYEQCATLESNVIAIKRLKKGEGIGYDHAYIAQNDMLVGIVGIGYGDGVRRYYSKYGFIDINGVKYKIIGNICMDCLFVDLNNNVKIKIGDSVKLFGNCSINVCEVATACDTISYEILTGVSKRVKRELINAGNNRCISR